MAHIIEQDKGIGKHLDGIRFAIARLQGKQGIDRAEIAADLRACADEIESGKSAETAPAPKKKIRKGIKKGDKVSFLDDETDETVEGVVTKATKKLLTVEYDGEEYEMEPHEAALVE